MIVIPLKLPLKPRRLGHRMVGLLTMAAWVAMPLMPALALAYTWLSGLS